jgi:hypothetical protein
MTPSNWDVRFAPNSEHAPRIYECTPWGLACRGGGGGGVVL